MISRTAESVAACPALSWLVMAAAPLAAQQTTGVPCSPSATTTVDGRYLPNPPRPVRRGHQPERQGLEVLLAARPWCRPKGAPNVLLIMTDDAGYGISELVRRRDPDAGDGPHGRRRACATPSSTPPRSARRPGRR